MTSAGAARRLISAVRAVGAVPMTKTAPGPTSLRATRIPAAERVIPALAASSAARGSWTRQVAARAVMPAATISESVTTGAPAASARAPAASASSAHTRSVR